MDRNRFARPEGFLDRSPSCANINPAFRRRLKIVYNAINQVIGLWTPLPFNISAGLGRKVIVQLRAWGHNDISEAEILTAIKIVKGIDEYLIADSGAKTRLRNRATEILADILSALETDRVENWSNLGSSVQENTKEVQNKAYAVYEVSIWLNSLHEQLVKQEQEDARKERRDEDIQHRLSGQSQTIRDLEEKLAAATARLSDSERDVTRLREENRTLLREIEAEQNPQALHGRIVELEVLVQEQRQQLDAFVKLQEEHKAACDHVELLHYEDRLFREENAQLKKREQVCREELLVLYANVRTMSREAGSVSLIVPPDSNPGSEPHDDFVLGLPTKMDDGREILYHRRHFVRRAQDFDSVSQGYVLAAMKLFAEDPFCPQLATEQIQKTRSRTPTSARVFRSYLPGLSHCRFLWRVQENSILIFRLYRKGTKEDTKRALASNL